MEFDFSFDRRVAKQYERQRAHPPEVSAQIGRMIAELVEGDGRVLEIGIGTGRIARPVAAAGCQVIGYDLSLEMLQQLKEQPNSFHIFQGDMHYPPFPANSFDAVLAVHVLHLADDWPQVLRQAARLLKPGALFIQGDDWLDPQSVVGMLRDELRRQAMALFPNTKPPAAGVNRQALLSALGGGRPQEVVAAAWETRISPAERLAQVENRMDAESWFLPEPVFNQLFAKLQAFAAAQWTDLAEKVPGRREFRLQITAGEWMQ